MSRSEQLVPLPRRSYSSIRRPLIDLKLIIRMLLVDYCEGTRSEWRLYEEAHLNLAYQWFCQLSL